MAEIKDLEEYFDKEEILKLVEFAREIHSISLNSGGTVNNATFPLTDKWTKEQRNKKLEDRELANPNICPIYTIELFGITFNIPVTFY